MKLDSPLDIAQIAARVSSEEELFDELAEHLKAASRADGCDIFLREANDGLVMRASTYAPEYIYRCRLGRGVGLCGQTLLSGQPTFIRRHANRHPQNVAYPGVDERDYQAVVSLPLIGNANVFGVILLHRLDPWPISESIKKRLLNLAESASLVVCGFQNAYRLGGSSNRIEALSQVSRTIAASPYLEEILQLLVNITAQQFNYVVCTVRLLDERRGELVLRATQAPVKAYQRKPAIKLGESIAGKAMAENRAIVVRDVMDDPDYIGHDLAAAQNLRSMVCVPLMIQDRPVGVLSCYTSEIREFGDDEMRALETLAKQAAFAIEHAKLQVRDTLMQEMHHRVKNNLQQVASLLRLQIRHGTYKSLEEALNDCLGRILAISSVHELLGREDLDHVGLKSLAENLVQVQHDSLMLPDRSIRFEVRGHDVHLNTQQATQVALVLNELVQNAVEHGFKDTLEGEVHITIEENDSEIGLWVSNSADPLPAEFDLEKSAHLGLKIVENLARGLGGKLILEDRLGWTVAEVKFTRATAE